MKSNTNSDKDRDNLSINWNKVINSLVMIVILVSSPFLFAIPMPVNAVVSLNIFGSDSIQHNTIDIEEDYSVGVGTVVENNLKVKANGLAKRQTMNAQWSCTEGVICSKATLAPASTADFGKPFGGTSGQPVSEIPFTLTLTIPSDMEVGTYHGKLEATGTVVQTGEVATPGVYFFRVTVIADAEPPVVESISFEAQPTYHGKNGWFNALDFTSPNSVTGTVTATDNIQVTDISCTVDGNAISVTPVDPPGYGGTSASATFIVTANFPYDEGENTVECTASDGINTSTPSSATIKIDTVPPTIDDPANILLSEDGGVVANGVITGSPGEYLSNDGVTGAQFTYEASASDVTSGPSDFGLPVEPDYTVDPDTGEVTVNFATDPGTDGVFECFPGINAFFGVGTTSIKCQAIDIAGNIEDPLVDVNFARDEDCETATNGDPDSFEISCGVNTWITDDEGNPVPLRIKSNGSGKVTVLNAGLGAEFNVGSDTVILFNPTFEANPLNDPKVIHEKWGLNSVPSGNQGSLGTPVGTAFKSLQADCTVITSEGETTSSININQNEEKTCNSGTATLTLSTASPDLVIVYNFAGDGTIKTEVTRGAQPGLWRPTQTDMFKSDRIVASGEELVVEPKPADIVIPGGSSGIVYPGTVYGSSEVTCIILDGANSSTQATCKISNASFTGSSTDTTGGVCDPPSNQCIKYEPKILMPTVETETPFDVLMTLEKITGKGKKESRTETRTIFVGTVLVKPTPESYLFVLNDEIVVNVNYASGIAEDANTSNGTPDYRVVMSVDSSSCLGGTCIVTQTAVYGLATDFRPFSNRIFLDPVQNSGLPILDTCYERNSSGTTTQINAGSSTLPIGKKSNGNIVRCLIQWDVSSISFPSSGTSFVLKLKYSTASNSGSPAAGKISSIESTPPGSSTTSSSVLGPVWVDTNDGTTYVSNWAPGANASFDLSPLILGTAVDNLKNAKSNGATSWSIGLSSDNGSFGSIVNAYRTVNAYESGSTKTRPQLSLSYTCSNGATTITC